jgi:hypothetical protein
VQMFRQWHAVCHLQEASSPLLPTQRLLALRESCLEPLRAPDVDIDQARSNSIGAVLVSANQGGEPLNYGVEVSSL